ncbi:MAG: hypothetical protein II736_06095 [Clostridia bacterium]|nr:hypothetical protein [Clostridia bacterium]
MEYQQKDKLRAGADEKTPSRPQYFSWINSTNEGSSEGQTIANLNYFKWLRDTYGMRLEIYAWDAGNLDGSRGTYETLGSPKLIKQYPRGYAPVAEAAAEAGIRLGVWCGPDGYGDTPEEAEARRELLVSLCRDLHFAQFKIDGVCSGLREEKQGEFVKTLTECRRYSPDLILLNHRLRLGIGEPYATTFLWEGVETYVDVHIANEKPAPHHRGFIFGRGNVPGLLRLAEDHGVCISSCIDYFEDDLIYQAFGRCLILAPEVYGNPWLMRDDEQEKMAAIYNLHRKWRDILVDGMLLPESYGPNAVARGDGKRRFIVTGNDSWESRTVTLKLDEEIGLQSCDRVVVKMIHPYEEFVCVKNYGECVAVRLAPFRAALIEVTDASVAEPVLTGCRYNGIPRPEGGKREVRIIAADGDIGVVKNGEITYPDEKIYDGPSFDMTVKDPVRIDRVDGWERESGLSDAERIYETALFAMNNDSLEYRSLLRSGETAIPEVRAARDAFFGQDTYKLRGCESRNCFDGRDDTFFDGGTKVFYGGYMRHDGECLRVDLGAPADADRIIIEYFETDEETPELLRQRISEEGDFSRDLGSWASAPLEGIETLTEWDQKVVVNDVHNIVSVKGKKMRATYLIGGKIRYFRAKHAPDRIYRIAALKDGEEIPLTDPKALVLLPHFAEKTVFGIRKTLFSLDKNVREGSYLAVSVHGEHGEEGAYAVVEINGIPEGAPDRAPSYPCVAWECSVCSSDEGYCYYFPVTERMKGRRVTVKVLECSKKATECSLSVHLCEPNDRREGVVVPFPG